MPADSVVAFAPPVSRVEPRTPWDLLGRSKKRDQEQETRRSRLDALRQLRAAVQGLHTVVAAIRDGRATLSGHAQYLEQSRTTIDRLLNTILTVLPDGDVAHGDDVQYISDQWQVLLCSPIVTPPNAPLSAADQVRELALCEEVCDCLVGRLGQLTIPARLNDWLMESWSGYLLSFHDIFSDELPNADRRQDLLRLLASVPGLVKGGLVEPMSGWIFPYHRHWFARWATCLGLLGLYLVASYMIWRLPDSRLIPLGAELNDHTQILLDWLLVVIGVATHYAIDRSKGGNAGAKSIPLGHATCAIDARAGIIVLKGMLMLIGFFGLILLMPGRAPGHLDFLLVGYSLDSFAGIVAASLDERSATRGSEFAKVARTKA